jgi:hypothetical protein
MDSKIEKVDQAKRWVQLQRVKGGYKKYDWNSRSEQ